MYIAITVLMLSLSAFPYAEEKDTDVGVIITNYEYDSFGRPRGQSVQVQQGPYYNTNPYNNPNYAYPYNNANLPGLDPDRMDDLFEQNSRK
jgi:hypothetical protein